MTRRILEIAAFCAALLLAALLFHAWLDAHDDQLRLASTLATQKQALDAADARERDRNATLKDALAQIDALKRNAQNQSPAQLARALQEALQLPQPITITAAPNSSVGAHAVPERPNSTTAPSNNADNAPEVRTAGGPPTPLPPNATQQPESQNSPQATQRHKFKSLVDSLFHRTPNANAPADTTSVAPAPAQAPPSSSQTQNENAAAPQSQQGTDATVSPANSLPAQPSAANQASSTNNALRENRAQSTHSTSAKNPASSASSASNPPPSGPNPPSAATAAKPTNAATAVPPPAAQTAEIPAADLAPLYNYVQDCRACQLQLTAAKQNASDDAAKIRALTHERDAAITAAKGGPLWLRLKRNSHWLSIGVVVGAATSAAALCHTGHCR